MGVSASTIQVPPVDVPKPAALHLYPHIHSTKLLPHSADVSQVGAAHVAAGGSISAANYKSLLQPQLYNLHPKTFNALDHRVSSMLIY